MIKPGEKHPEHPGRGRSAAGRLRDIQRRASGPLDRSTFAPRRIVLPPSPYSAELARLSLYRLGLTGTWGKYRIVPRSAIVGYDELRESVRANGGDGELQSLITALWQRHGAPSRSELDRFLAEASRLERSGSPDARKRLLEEWLEACAPPSALERARERAELAVAFLLRRARQYLRAAVAKLR